MSSESTHRKFLDTDSFRAFFLNFYHSLDTVLPLKEQYFHYSAEKHKPCTPQSSALSPFWHLCFYPPTLRGQWYTDCEGVRQSIQRQGNRKSNFTWPKRNTVVMAHTKRKNDAHQGYYFSLFFTLLAVTRAGILSSEKVSVSLSVHSLVNNIFPLSGLKQQYHDSMIFFCKHQLVTIGFRGKKKGPAVLICTWQCFGKRVPLEPCHPSTSAAILTLHTHLLPCLRASE